MRARSYSSITDAQYMTCHFDVFSRQRCNYWMERVCMRRSRRGESGPPGKTLERFLIEARNEDFRRFRQCHTRTITRRATNTDIMFLVSSDPLIEPFRKQVQRKPKPLDTEVLTVLICEQSEGSTENAGHSAGGGDDSDTGSYTSSESSSNSSITENDSLSEEEDVSIEWLTYSRDRERVLPITIFNNSYSFGKMCPLTIMDLPTHVSHEQITSHFGQLYGSKSASQTPILSSSNKPNLLL